MRLFVAGDQLERAASATSQIGGRLLGELSETSQLLT